MRMVEVGEKGSRRMHRQTKAKRRIIPVSPSGTYWFSLYSSYCCAASPSSFFCFAQKTRKYSRNRVKRWKWPRESVGAVSRQRAICILGTKNTKKSWQHLTYNFPADRTLPFLCSSSSALVVFFCVFLACFIGRRAQNMQQKRRAAGGSSRGSVSGSGGKEVVKGNTPQFVVAFIVLTW